MNPCVPVLQQLFSLVNHVIDVYRIIGAFHYWTVGYRPYTLVSGAGRPENGFFKLVFIVPIPVARKKYSTGT